MVGFFYVIKQYERGVQFRLGRVRDGARGPGANLRAANLSRSALRLFPLRSGQQLSAGPLAAPT